MRTVPLCAFLKQSSRARTARRRGRRATRPVGLFWGTSPRCSELLAKATGASAGDSALGPCFGLASAFRAVLQQPQKPTRALLYLGG